MCGIPDLLTHLVRPRVGTLHLGGRLTFGGNQRWPHGNLQRKLLLRACRGLWEGGEHLQALGEEPDALVIRAPLGRVFRCLPEILHRTPIVLPPLKVHRQLGRVRAGLRPIARFLPSVRCKVSNR